MKISCVLHSVGFYCGFPLYIRFFCHSLHLCEIYVAVSPAWSPEQNVHIGDTFSLYDICTVCPIMFTLHVIL